MSVNKTSKQTVGTPQVDTSISAPGLIVAARPANFSTPHVEADMSGVERLRSIAKGLHALTPVIGRVGEAIRTKNDDRDFMIGQADRVRAGELATNGYADYMADNGIETGTARARGFMAAHGRASAHKDKLSLSKFVKEHPSQIVTNDQLNEVITNFMGTQLKGNEDEDFLENYLSIMQNAEASIRDTWAKDQYLQVQQQQATDINVGLRGDLADAHAGGADIQGLLDVSRGYAAHAKAVGLPRETVMDLTLEAMKELAIETEDVSIFGEEAGDFGMWELAYPDIDNPGKMIPGRANSPKFQAKLGDIKRQVQRSISSKAAKRNEMAVLKHGYRIQDAMDKGDFAVARELNEAGVNHEYYTGTAALSTNNRITVAEAKYERKLRNAEAYEQNVLWAADMTTAEKQTAVDDYAMELRSNATDLNSQIEANQMIREKQVKNAVMDTRTQEALKSTSPMSNPVQFAVVHREYNAYMALDPAYTFNMIGQDAYRMHFMYDSALLAGMKEGEAMAYVNQANTPETRARIKDLTSGEAGYEMRDKIHKELIRKKHDAWVDKDAANAGFIQDRVTQSALVHYAITGNMEESIKFGIEAHKARNHLVEYPDGSGSHYVDMKGRPLPPDYSDAEKALNADEEYRAEIGLPDGVFVYGAPNDLDPSSDRFLLRRTDNGMPIPYTKPNGELGLRSYDPYELVNKHRGEVAEANYKTDEQLRAEQAKANSIPTNRTRGQQKAHDANNQ